MIFQFVSGPAAGKVIELSDDYKPITEDAVRRLMRQLPKELWCRAVERELLAAYWTGRFYAALGPQESESVFDEATKRGFKLDMVGGRFEAI